MPLPGQINEIPLSLMVKGQGENVRMFLQYL